MIPSFLFHSSFPWPNCYPPPLAGRERSCESDRRHPVSAWVGMDVDWQQPAAVCSDVPPSFFQDGSLDLTLKRHELGITHVVEWWVILTLCCRPGPSTPNVLSLLDQWIDLWMDYLINEFLGQTRPPQTPICEPTQPFQNSTAAASCPGDKLKHSPGPEPSATF